VNGVFVYCVDLGWASSHVGGLGQDNELCIFGQCVFLFFSFLVVLGIELGAVYLLGKYSTT
jgi:hypothetical protein